MVQVTCEKNKVSVFFNGNLIDSWNVARHYGDAMKYIQKHPNGRHGKRFYSWMRMFGEEVPPNFRL